MNSTSRTMTFVLFLTANSCYGTEHPSLSTDLIVDILERVDNPKVTYMVNKDLTNRMKKRLLVNSSEERITMALAASVDKGHKIRPDSFLNLQLNGPLSIAFVSRLVTLMTLEDFKTQAALIRGILTQHVRTKNAKYRDALIELSRQKPTIRADALKIIRGSFPHNMPVIHSSEMPPDYAENIEKAVPYAVWSHKNKVLRTWAFPQTPLKMLKTISVDGGEDTIVALNQDATRDDPEFEKLLED